MSGPTQKSRQRATDETALKAKANFLVTPDGLTLKTYEIAPRHPNGKTAFLTHSQAQHSANLLPTAIGLAEQGYRVHMADLRGHGHSSGDRAPLGHMEINQGWERLVSDLQLAFENAFGNTAWEDRLVIAPNIGAALTLEILKSWPDLAQNIVLSSPTPNQSQLHKLGQAFTKARLIFNKQNKPDELTQHQLYRFLGLQLKEHSRLIDVMSSDTDITDALLQDPYAWPTPTTGYFHEMFRGLEQSWRWAKDQSLKDGTRCLILYGTEDPVVGRGQFVGPIHKSLTDIGFQSIDMQEIPGGRSGLIIDNARLKISERIQAWHHREDLSFSDDVRDIPVADEMQSVLSTLSMSLLQEHGRVTDGVLRPEELVELCYTAVNDERHWAEMFYHLALKMSESSDFDTEQLDSLIGQLMPHFERSYELSRQVMKSVILGSVLQDVIDRFGLAMAIVDNQGHIVQANDAFNRAMPLLFDADATQANRSFAQLIRAQTLTARNEALIMYEQSAIAFYFQPPVLRQVAAKQGGGSGVVLLRPLNTTVDTTAGSDPTDKIELLRLAYKLTNKEAEVAMMTLSGRSQDDGARTLSVSINTFKTHLKSVYEKLGVRGQSELTARLLNGPFGLIANA